jgi:hypothetical protein
MNRFLRKAVCRDKRQNEYERSDSDSHIDTLSAFYLLIISRKIPDRDDLLWHKENLPIGGEKNNPPMLFYANFSLVFEEN